MGRRKAATGLFNERNYRVPGPNGLDHLPTKRLMFLADACHDRNDFKQAHRLLDIIDSRRQSQTENNDPQPIIQKPAPKPIQTTLI